jgi:hypothetical protein
MSKFSNIEKYLVLGHTLKIENETLTSDDLNELFNNEYVKTNVYTISMINCNLSEIPESIINLTSMRELYLNYNNISNFPENFGKLKLDILQLSGNPVTVNEHNINILQQVYNNTPPTSTRKNAARPRIYFDNEDRRSYKNKPIAVIGGIDLVHQNNDPTKERPRNKHVLLQSDFDKLYNQIESSHVVQETAPKLSSSSSSSSPPPPSPPSSSSSSLSSSSSSSSKKRVKKKNSTKSTNSPNSKRSTKKSSPK